jgi:hypothetical protein
MKPSSDIEISAVNLAIRVLPTGWLLDAEPIKSLRPSSMCEKWSSAFAISVEHGLDIQYRGAIDRLEVAHAQAAIIDRADLDPVEPYRVRPFRGTSAEYPLLGVREVIAGMNSENIATRSMQPGQYEHLNTWPQVAQGVTVTLVKDQPRVGRAFVTLLRRDLCVDQR